MIDLNVIKKIIFQKEPFQTLNDKQSNVAPNDLFKKKRYF